MTNQGLDEYLRSVETNIAHIPHDERQTTIREMRSHLHEQIVELRRTDLEMGEIEATERAIKSFGDPTEIGVLYGNGGAAPVVVNKNTGEVLLRTLRATGRVAAATGRGIGRTLKWILFVVFAILFLALGSALTLLIVFQDDIRETVPRTIHSYSRNLDAASGQHNGTFLVSEDAKEVRVQLRVNRQGTSGCATISIRDPSGSIVFDSSGDCNDLSALLTYYDAGKWTIHYTYTAFDGYIDVDVYAFERAD